MRLHTKRLQWNMLLTPESDWTYLELKEDLVSGTCLWFYTYWLLFLMTLVCIITQKCLNVSLTHLSGGARRSSGLSSLFLCFCFCLSCFWNHRIIAVLCFFVERLLCTRHFMYYVFICQGVPFMMRRGNKTQVWYTGLCMDLLDILASRLNFTWVKYLVWRQCLFQLKRCF